MCHYAEMWEKEEERQGDNGKSEEEVSCCIYLFRQITELVEKKREFVGKKKERK